MTPTTSGPVSALILAGRRGSGRPDVVAAAGGQAVKALVEINGKAMIDRVVTTLRQSGAVAEIHLCLPDDLDLSSSRSRVATELAEGTLFRVPTAPSPSASVRQFVAPRLAQKTVLVTTADHPLLTPAMVIEFLRGFSASGAEVAAALTRTDAIVARYPESRRTRLAFADGDFSGCNLFAFRGPGATRVLDFWRRVEQHRKQPWRIAHALGWVTLLLYLCRRLSLAALFARLSRRAGTRLHAVLLEDPHAGIDVDTVEDLQLVTSIITKREGGVGQVSRTS